jgi:hypothetical protein
MSPTASQEVLHRYLNDRTTRLRASDLSNLWRNDVPLPDDPREKLGIPAGSTYGDAVQHLAMLWHRHSS